MKRNESEENYAASNNLIANQASSNNLSSDPGTATNLPDGKAGNMASQARSKQSVSHTLFIWHRLVCSFKFYSTPLYI